MEAKRVKTEKEKKKDNNGNSAEGKTVFLKCGSTVKQALFKGDSMEQLRKLFIEKFNFSQEQSDQLRSFPITTIKPDNRKTEAFEISNIASLEANNIVEIKLPVNREDKSLAGIGYYAFQRQRLVFVMVGLPARGKSYIAFKMCRYLKWVGVNTRIFNVGQYRRERIGAFQNAEFFNPTNEKALRQRKHMAIAALDDMLMWLHCNGNVAIYDATNSTRERRDLLIKRCSREDVGVVFIESVCNDVVVLEKNVLAKRKSPDYTGIDPKTAVADFRQRIKQYEKIYETLHVDIDKDYSWCKIIDVGRQYIVNQIESYLPCRVIHFLMNLHITTKRIWLTRHGQSVFNVSNRIGGDCGLTAKGEEYAHALADWVDTNIGEESLQIWTSTLQRSIATAQYINHSKYQLRVLDEIDAGVCDGMTYEEIAEKMPEEFAARVANKLKYRYPQGESYEDVMMRLEPVLFELERQRSPILVVAHQAVLRCIFAYFRDIDIEEVPWISVNLNTVYEFTARAYGTDVRTYKLANNNS